jgi:hypothetical protein
MKTINIAGTSYPLKYGYGAFRLLGEYWNQKGIQGVIKVFNESFANMDKEQEFDALNKIGDLVNAGIENAGGETIERDEILQEVMFKDAEKLQIVMDEFVKSIPGAENGKKKVSQKKPPRTKAKKK